MNNKLRIFKEGESVYLFNPIGKFKIQQIFNDIYGDVCYVITYENSNIKFIKNNEINLDKTLRDNNYIGMLKEFDTEKIIKFSDKNTFLLNQDKYELVYILPEKYKISFDDDFISDIFNSFEISGVQASKFIKESTLSEYTELPYPQLIQYIQKIGKYEEYKNKSSQFCELLKIMEVILDIDMINYKAYGWIYIDNLIKAINIKNLPLPNFEGYKHIWKPKLENILLEYIKIKESD